MQEFISVKQILLNGNCNNQNETEIEVYQKKELLESKVTPDKEANWMTIIVKRINFIFDEKECQLINFTDLTAFTQLQKEVDTNRLLKTLNASVHHEMLVPIKTMIEIAERLVKKFKSFPQEKKMVETILLSSQFILMHAHDFLDQQIIEHGNFVSYFETENIVDAI